MKRAFALSLALVFVLLVAVPVSAARPVVEPGEAVFDWEVLDEALQPLCPGFAVWDHEVVTWVWMSQYDDEGNLLRVEAHISGTDNFHNPANPGVVLSGDFTGNYHYNARTGKEYVTGVPYHITVPGYGTVLLRAGRWYGFEAVHIAGKDSFVSPKDMEQFCACLAGK